MIDPGERLENPVTGEVLVFHRTSAQTDGEEVSVEVMVHPHGFVAAAHVHPYQTERFEVLEGRLGLRFTVQVRPALRFESLIETMFTLAAEGKTNRKGLPNPLRLAVIAQAHFDTVRLPFPPAPLQRAALALAVPLGKTLGYRATVTRPRSPETVRPHGRPIRTYERGRPHRTGPALESRRPPR
jgi:hypothetical protein